MMHVYRQLLAAWEAGNEVILASVVQTCGSTYRKVGAEMIVDRSGNCWGQLSGGCLEQDIVERCLQLLHTEKPFQLVEYLRYSTLDPFADDQSGCNGDMRILLTRTDWLQPYRSELERALEQELAISHLIVLDGPAELVGVRAFFIDGCPIHTDRGSEWFIQSLPASGLSGLSTDEKTGAVYYRQQVPPIRKLLLAGAGNDTIPVVRFATAIGYQVHLCDFRSAYLEPNRFAAADVVLHQIGRNRNDWDGLLARFSPHTPFVAMSHHLEYDRLSVEAALQRGLRYIGVLGNKSRLRLFAADILPEQAERIHCPVGLPIGAETPEEIALSIVSQVLSFQNRPGRRQGDGSEAEQTIQRQTNPAERGQPVSQRKGTILG
ncbi:XdhC family protein [Brevibacillus humidisoli]|uniref:XdhC family protein n=1 Tax=Brevibacillus humidisoli TaxID=2895522 RepID=UPI001E63B2BE|nr:XdhC/CoxI family protein [Brevibacillus humidisoli]UFJ42447.1 XdhC family protein [Brevibacillus humidisoli]